MPAQRDGPDRRRRGLVRELAAIVLEMTLPAIAVSVIGAAATGCRTRGTKVIQGSCPWVRKVLRPIAHFPKE